MFPLFAFAMSNHRIANKLSKFGLKKILQIQNQILNFFSFFLLCKTQNHFHLLPPLCKSTGKNEHLPLVAVFRFNVTGSLKKDGEKAYCKGFVNNFDFRHNNQLKEIFLLLHCSKLVNKLWGGKRRN